MSIIFSNDATTVGWWPRLFAVGRGVMLGILRRTFVVVLGVSSVMLPFSASEASTASNTFVLSGQVKGTLTLDISKTCVAGNIERSGGATTVRIFLTARDIKPLDALWFLLFETKSAKVKFPAASPTEMTLGSASGPSITDEEWNAGATSGAGTVAFGRGYDSGVLNMNLDPAPFHENAKRPEKIVGRWSCP